MPVCGHAGLGTNVPETFMIFETSASQLSEATGYEACAEASPEVLLHSKVTFRALEAVTHAGAVLSVIVMTCV